MPREPALDLEELQHRRQAQPLPPARRKALTDHRWRQDIPCRGQSIDLDGASPRSCTKSNNPNQYLSRSDRRSAPVNKRLRRWITALAAVLVPLGALSLVGTPSANAELTHPRQAFLRSATDGLFLHWGLRTGPSHNDCAAWEQDVTNGGWKASYWVQEAQKLHLQYLLLATFHSRLGYARAWPSKIPGTCSTKRDFLGELIDAADAQGMKVILYMTDDPGHHNEGGTEWMNSAAYSKYKGHSVNLSGRPGFGEFSYDNFIEVMPNYPKLGGFWSDNENAYWKSHGLYAKNREKRANFTLSNNKTDTPAFDMMSNERKTR